ncbi:MULTISPECIES: acyl-CoA dehydrogenase [Nocardioides]|uniref:acyl-CoA dehydrogenase n=1 Tax=Nocardioides TaxID=1839 RepID=UPI00032E80E7|nr:MULTISPECIES: acyl-CoA dehydrogenase [Nocardioides]EON23803.1 acyl-CoA dehydrogenase domain-containing [Nocardioides sp. CF8]
MSEEVDAVAAVVADAVGRSTDWATLAGSGLLSLVVPTDHGGEGLGLAELAVVLRAVGRSAVQVPVWETLCVGALTIAAAGSDDQQKSLLPGVASGEVVLAAALREVGPGFPDVPATTVSGDRVTGRKISVQYADRAAMLLVSAVTDGRPVVGLVDPRADGVTLLESASSRALLDGVVEHTVVLDDAPIDLLPGADAFRIAHDNAVAGLVVLAAGLLAGARDLTADHVKQRTQFGRALAEFQAVAMQVADVYIASRTLDLAADNAVWRIASGLDVRDDLAVAAYWTCAEAPAAIHTCHHLHGGTGVDEAYPLHHHYSWLTDITHALGGPAGTLRLVAIESAEAKNLELTASQRALKAELRAYFTGLVSDAERTEMARERHGATYEKTIRQMGADGWMGVGWPEAYGGRGLGEVEQTIFANEAQRADVHLPAVTLQTVGPTLQKHGTPKQKELFLERILAGDVHFAIGYSEPDAGTDLASLRTTARRDGDHYVVNGQKIFTTGGHQADYVWLAVRTDPDAPKHKGISILIVDTTDPGYSWTPIITVDGAHHTNATYYSDVRVPVDMLVGEENAGWKLITTQLNHERVMLGPAGRLEGLRDRVASWAADRGVLELPDVQAALGEVTAIFRVNELLNWEVARAAADGEISVADASSSKVFASEQVQHVGRVLADVVARHGDPSDPDTASLVSHLDGQAKRNLVITFGGGVNEVQRELIAMFGLGLPRVPR